MEKPLANNLTVDPGSYRLRVVDTSSETPRRVPCGKYVPFPPSFGAYCDNQPVLLSLPFEICKQLPTLEVADEHHPGILALAQEKQHGQLFSVKM